MTYANTQEYRDAITSGATDVYILLGGNDAKGKTWRSGGKAPGFVADYDALVSSFAAMGSSPRLLLITPPHLYYERYGMQMGIMNEEMPSLIRDAAERAGAAFLDLNTAFLREAATFQEPSHTCANIYARMACT